MDPADIRLKNMIPRFENGHAVITGLTYDSGDYPAATEEGPRPRRVHGPAQGTGGGAQEGPATWASASGPTSRSAGSVRHRWRARSGSRAGSGRARLSASIRPARCRSSSAPRRTGREKRRRSRSSSPSEIGVDVNDVKVDARRHRRVADGLGDVRQPHDRGRRGGAGSGDTKVKEKAKVARRAPARGGASRTWTTPTASSS